MRHKQVKIPRKPYTGYTYPLQWNIHTFNKLNLLHQSSSFLYNICDLLLQTREQVASTSVSFYLYSNWNQYDQKDTVCSISLALWLWHHVKATLFHVCVLCVQVITWASTLVARRYACDANIEAALFSCDVTTKVQVKWGLFCKFEWLSLLTIACTWKDWRKYVLGDHHWPKLLVLLNLPTCEMRHI